MDLFKCGDKPLLEFGGIRWTQNREPTSWDLFKGRNTKKLALQSICKGKRALPVVLLIPSTFQWTK
jgi:hypothetical protein